MPEDRMAAEHKLTLAIFGLREAELNYEEEMTILLQAAASAARAHGLDAREFAERAAREHRR